MATLAAPTSTGSGGGGGGPGAPGLPSAGEGAGRASEPEEGEGEEGGGASKGAVIPTVSCAPLYNVRLHMYDHCVFCVKVQIMLAYKNISFERVLYGYGDANGCVGGSVGRGVVAGRVCEGDTGSCNGQAYYRGTAFVTRWQQGAVASSSRNGVLMLLWRLLAFLVLRPSPSPSFLHRTTIPTTHRHHHRHHIHHHRAPPLPPHPPPPPPPPPPPLPPPPPQLPATSSPRLWPCQCPPRDHDDHQHSRSHQPLTVSPLPTCTITAGPRSCWA
jgi:hypothetical protein